MPVQADCQVWEVIVTSNIKLMTYLNTGLDVDGGDLLHNLGGGMQVNHPLVNPSKKKTLVSARHSQRKKIFSTITSMMKVNTF